MTLINSVLCTTAYFSILEPGTKIKPHNGVYKGVLRYHLGLIVPSGDLFIEIDGKSLHLYHHYIFYQRVLFHK